MVLAVVFIFKTRHGKIVCSNYINLNTMWDKIDLESSDKEKDIIRWKQEYMKNIVEDLIELKIKAKKENNPSLYDQLRISLIRAHEVQNGLNQN